jgi:hypothetical protein
MAFLVGTGISAAFYKFASPPSPGKLIDIVRNPHTVKVKRIKAMGEALG